MLIQASIHGIHGATKSAPPQIIVYLGQLGQPSPASASTSLSAASLARALSAVTVDVHYRASPAHRHPTPTHDVLFAYDWILKNIVSNRSFFVPGFNDILPARIGVYGTGLGGGLAAMLALTECHRKGHRLAAAALHDPLLNWVLPEEKAAVERTEPRSRTKESEPGVVSAALRTLKGQRENLFKHPQEWFDPFASPILFFRSAAATVPPAPLARADEEFAELARLEQDDFLRHQLKLSSITQLPSSEIARDVAGETDGTDATGTPRRSSRRYPRPGSGLVLPNFRVDTNSNGIFHEQAADFARQVRRSLVRTDMAERVDEHLTALLADQRVLHETLGPDYNSDEHLEAVTDWFRNNL